MELRVFLYSMFLAVSLSLLTHRTIRRETKNTIEETTNKYLHTYPG